jgi:hypothetical protein
LGVNTTGANNTAVGSNTLDANNASNNTAIGFNALTANTTAAYNTAVGYGALATTTTGPEHVAIGGFALNLMATGEACVAVGQEALRNNLGSSNTAVGYQSMDACTDGTQLTAVGRASLGAVTTGSGLVAMGMSALGSITTGTNGTAVGFDALKLATGANNTAVGYTAGDAISTGANNTIIGSTAGDTITTGGSNIIIGYGADGDANAENQIVMGVSISSTWDNVFVFGKASNVTYNDFTSDNSWTQSSDVRKKKDIEDAVLGLDFVNDLRPVTYEWKPNNEFPEDFAEYGETNHMTLGVRMHGLVAQEVKTALDKTGVARFAGWKETPEGVQCISKEMFVIPLIKAVQELSAKVKKLEEE